MSVSHVSGRLNGSLLHRLYKDAGRRKWSRYYCTGTIYAPCPRPLSSTNLFGISRARTNIEYAVVTDIRICMYVRVCLCIYLEFTVRGRVKGPSAMFLCLTTLSQLHTIYRVIQSLRRLLGRSFRLENANNFFFLDLPPFPSYIFTLM
jgi:hypothetical protein